MSDKLGPIEIEFLLDKKADAEAKNLKNSLDAVGTSGKKAAQQVKDAIKEQKEIIKSVELDVKKLQKAYDDAVFGKAKSNIGKDLGQAKRALTEERGTLLGLQKQQITANEKEADSQNSIIGKLKGWALGLVTVGAALKITKSIIESTESTTHAFNMVIDQAKAGIGYFFKAIASGDWSNFREGLVKSMNSARDFVNAMEDIENRTNEQKIKSAEISSQINELREGTFDQDIENNEKLITNLKEIIELQKKDYAAQALIAKDTYESTLRNAAIENRIDKEKLDNLISEYTKNKEIIELGEKYNVLQIRLNAARKSAVNISRIKEIKAEITALGEGAEAAGKMAEEYGKVPMPLRDSLASLKAEQIKLEGLAKIGSKFDERRLATAENVKKKAEEEAKKKAIEDAKTENQIKIQTELLNTAIKKGNDEDAKAIAERISELKKELELRNKIAQSLIDIAGYEGFVPKQGILPGMPSVLPKAKPKQKTWEQLQEGRALVPFNMKTFNDEKKNQKELSEAEQKALEEQLRLRNEIVQAAASLINKIGQQIGLDEKSMSLLNAGLDAFTRLASGDLIGAAVSMLSGIIAQIPSAASKFAAQIEHINQLLKEQERLITLSERKGEQEKNRKDELEYLRQKEKLDRAEYERLQRSANKHLDLLGWRQKKADEAYQTWQDTIDLIEDSNQALTDFYTTTTEYGIADAIAQGFQDGKTSAADFAETFNDLMRNAINSALEEMSKPEIAAWYQKFADDMASGGELTDAEREDLKKDWDKIIADNKRRREEAYRIAGMDPTGGDTNSLTGAIKGITEEQASLLAGQTNAIRIAQATANNTLQSSLTQLMIISDNTSYLKSIDKKLDALKDNSLRATGVI
jgi:hypothetical protein